VWVKPETVGSTEGAYIVRGRDAAGLLRPCSTYHTAKPTMNAKTARPPTTPPAIAPALTELCCEEVEEVVAPEVDEDEDEDEDEEIEAVPVMTVEGGGVLVAE